MRVVGLVFLGGILHVGTALKLNNASSSKESHRAGKQDMVYDFGFYNGMDSWSYLHQGFRVVAVEADPSLVQGAHQNTNFQPFLQSGQLQLLNIAIAPGNQDVEEQLPFYLSKCDPEWNSFFSSIGCRNCHSPHTENPAMCVVQNVMAKPCATVFQQHGTAKYMKLDIEGAEGGCYHAMSQLPATSRPFYISAEVGNNQLVDTLAGLGYTSFKLVSQKSGHSGGWGDSAHDCKTGLLWRSIDGARQELAGIFTKGPVPNDPCPGSQTGGTWYDVHASFQPHQTW